MKLKLFAIATFAAAVMVSCGSGDKASAEQKAEGMTEFDAGGPVVFVNNATITPDKTLPTIIDFNATWCGPCRRFAPIFEEVAKEYKGKAIFMSVDVDNSPVAAQQFEVSAIPQVSILLPDGTYTSSVGFLEKQQFVDFISTAIK
ncbi:MAG: hypothetical protein K2J65_06775 [Duncaniella sp.]|nr:hypothetical protein [Duncaniella sp.]